MQQQNQIKRTLGQPESIDIVRSHLASNNYKKPYLAVQGAVSAFQLL